MKQIKITIFYFIIMSAILGLVYPLLMTGIAKFAFSAKAGGSLIKTDDRVYGSRLIGQLFTTGKYFHSRPSASNYDASNSGGSNWGPTNKKLIDRVVNEADKIRKKNNLAPDALVPADLVLASGSGLDPHISLESAMLQVQRVADARKMKPSDIVSLIKKHTETRYFGLGDSFVNIFELNIELDKI